MRAASLMDSAAAEFASPSAGHLPRHLAVVMDGNGRWAERRRLSRVQGHRRGLDSARTLVRSCASRGIRHLTLFAFSSENWRRPREEVETLMNLMAESLLNHADELLEAGARLFFIGDRSRFPESLRRAMAKAESATESGERISLAIAANYGGRWDIVNAVRRLIADNIPPENIDEEAVASRLSLAGIPPPDLLIRTGGELRLSNFLLWHLAYAELYFSDTLWPDFDEDELNRALASFAVRERRFGTIRQAAGGQ